MIQWFCTQIYTDIHNKKQKGYGRLGQMVEEAAPWLSGRTFKSTIQQGATDQPLSKVPSTHCSQPTAPKRKGYTFFCVILWQINHFNSD